MPNDVRQRMVIKGDSEEVQRVLDTIAGDPGSANELFDLNCIILIPESIERTMELCHVDAIRKGVATDESYAKYLQEKREAQTAAWIDTGFENWAQWSQHHWGTKWNVYFIERSEDEPNVLYFSSAWSPIIPALIELSRRFPRVVIELTFAEEGAYLIGRATFRAGGKKVNKYDSGSPEGAEIFARFWGDEAIHKVLDLTDRAAS
jgi:Ferredoxin-like domain in Api92-like protein